MQRLGVVGMVVPAVSSKAACNPIDTLPLLS